MNRLIWIGMGVWVILFGDAFAGAALVDGQLHHFIGLEKPYLSEQTETKQKDTNCLQGLLLASSGTADKRSAKNSDSTFSDLKTELKEGFHELKEGFGDLSEDWDEWLKEFKTLSKEDAVKALKKDVAELREEMKQSSREWKKKVRKEVLPKMREELNQLKKELRGKGQEKELKSIEKQMNALQTI